MSQRPKNVLGKTDISRIPGTKDFQYYIGCLGWDEGVALGLRKGDLEKLESRSKADAQTEWPGTKMATFMCKVQKKQELEKLKPTLETDLW